MHTGSIEIIFFNLKPSTLSLSLSLSRVPTSCVLKHVLREEERESERSGAT